MGEGSTFGRAGKNYLGVFVGNLLARGINFLLVAYLARRLGLKAYGELSWAQASLTLGLLFGDWGLQTQGIRVLAKAPEVASSTAAIYVGLRIILSVAVALLLAAFAYAAAPSSSMAQLTALFGFVVIATGLLPDWVLTGIHRMAYSGLSRAIQYACYAGLVLMLVRSPADVVYVPLANAGGLTSSALLLFFILRRRFPGWRPVFAKGSWPPILKEATPLVISNLVIQVYYSFPILLLGWIRGERATAYYNSAYRVVLVLYEVLTLFFTALYPVVAERWAKDPATVQPLLSRVIRLVLVLTVPIAAGGTVLGEHVMRLVFGEKFGPSALAFKIMIWVLVLLGVNGIYAQLVLLMHGQQRAYLRVSAIAAGVSLACNLVLISRYGHIGAAVTWVIAEATVGVAGYVAARQLVTLPALRYLVKPLLAAGVMAAICWLLLRGGAPVSAIIACAVLVYGILSLLIGVIDEDEVALLRELLRRAPRQGGKR